MPYLLLDVFLGGWRQFVVVHGLFDLCSELFCFSCFGRSVEMMYDAGMLFPDMGGPRYGLILRL